LAAAAVLMSCVPSSASTPGAPTVAPPAPDCTFTVRPGAVDGDGTAARPFGEASPAADAARPGDVICVTDGDLGDDPVVLTRSGAEDARIVLRAQGTVTSAGFEVRADYWRVEGFDVVARGDEPRPGILVNGRGVEVVGNSVTGSTDNGIRCGEVAPYCDGAMISSNRVENVVGSGIFVFGADITVESNDVSGSVQVGASDADGIRFFGDRITLRHNHIHDISAAGWPEGEEPHTDCFQTFTDSKRPISDAVVEGNTCDAVDAQCLIAEGTGDARGLTFANNICRTSGSQALYLRNVQGVVVANNLFLPPIEFTGVYLDEGSDGAVIVNNAFVGDIDAYVARNSAPPIADYNLAALPGGGGRPGLEEPHGVVGTPPAYLDQLDDLRADVTIDPTDPTVDAGTVDFAPTVDRLGRPRPNDGNADGAAAYDIGPFEA
jgi:hypothetical protein